MVRPVTWKFRKPTEADIRLVADHMRTEDRREMKRLTGLDPEWGLRHSVADSDAVYAAELACGEVCSIFGAVRSNLVDSTGVLWNLSTDTVNRHPIEFAVASRDGFDRVMNDLSDIEEFVNFVDTDYKSAMRWIEWLGGAFTIKGLYAGKCGGTFRQFYIENPHYTEDL